MNSKTKIGLVMTGGGAQAAYLVGVLKTIDELLPGNASSLFKIICGTSAVALNATTTATTTFHPFLAAWNWRR